VIPPSHPHREISEYFPNLSSLRENTNLSNCLSSAMLFEATRKQHRVSLSYSQYLKKPPLKSQILPQRTHSYSEICVRNESPRNLPCQMCTEIVHRILSNRQCFVSFQHHCMGVFSQTWCAKRANHEATNCVGRAATGWAVLHACTSCDVSFVLTIRSPPPMIKASRSGLNY
jgi:hypothetical protein